MAEVKGFTFSAEYYELINDPDIGLSVDEKGGLYKSIIEYIFDQKKPVLKGASKLIFDKLLPKGNYIRQNKRLIIVWRGALLKAQVPLPQPKTQDFKRKTHKILRFFAFLERNLGVNIPFLDRNLDRKFSNLTFRLHLKDIHWKSLYRYPIIYLLVNAP